MNDFKRFHNEQREFPYKHKLIIFFCLNSIYAMNKFLLTTLTLHVNILGININNVLIEYAIVRVKNCIHNKRMSGNKTSFIKIKNK